MLPVPTVADLATFTGRPQAVLGAFAPEALAQATLLFQFSTKLTALPTDPDRALLAQNAILEMADRLLLEQPYQAISHKPFQSETIGAYTYSKSTATALSLKANQGIGTGLFWWDLAVGELSVAGSTNIGTGAVRSPIHGLVFAPDGQVEIQSPAAGIDRPPYIRIS